MHDQITLDRRHFLGLVGLAAGSAAIAYSPARALGSALIAEDGSIMEWDELGPGVRAIVDLNTGGNTLALVSANSVLLVDTKFPQLGRALKTDATGFNAAADGELILVNSHHHGDHTGGNGSVVPFASASYAHANAIPRIAESFAGVKADARKAEQTVIDAGGSEALAKSARRTERAAAKWRTSTIIPKNPVEGEKNSFTLGMLGVDLYHYGSGHTDNDLIIHIPERNLMHTGDLVFNGLNPFMFPAHGATAKGWITSLQGAHKLCDAETTVVPGHGVVGDRSIIENQINYFEQLIDAVQKEIDSGVSKEDAAKKSWSFMNGLGFERIKSRAIEAVYDELAG